MDQKRLFLAIAVSLGIMIVFQTLLAPMLPQPPAKPVATEARQADGTPATAASGAQPAAGTTAAAVVPREVPRVMIEGKRVSGSISLLGARIDDLLLTDYRETIDPASRHVRLFEPRSEAKPYYAQYGWTALAGETVKLPDNDTVWTASAGPLTRDRPVTLSWTNGDGLTFRIELGIDDDYLFNVRQSVTNATGQAVRLYPWSRVRRDYKPEVLGYYILFEGLLGVLDNKLQEVSYDSAKSDAPKNRSCRCACSTAPPCERLRSSRFSSAWGCSARSSTCPSTSRS